MKILEIFRNFLESDKMDFRPPPFQIGSVSLDHRPSCQADLLPSTTATTKRARLPARVATKNTSPGRGCSGRQIIETLGTDQSSP